MIVSIVTPCYNAENYIKKTIESVLNQEAFLNERAVLDYIIVDGDSTDNTLHIINEVIFNHPLKDNVHIISEPDNGMYDALLKGMQLSKGEIFAYINADDYYSPYAVDIVLDIMEDESVNWLTGWAVGYNKNGQFVHVAKPFAYRNDFLLKGIYGVDLPFLQQESTFWRAELNKKLDIDILKKIKLAGDYYIWHEFSKHAQLTLVDAYIGGFRIHKDQLSKHYENYIIERDTFILGKKSFFDRFKIFRDKVLWKIDLNVLKDKFSYNIRYRYDFNHDTWKKVQK